MTILEMFTAMVKIFPIAKDLFGEYTPVLVGVGVILAPIYIKKHTKVLASLTESIGVIHDKIEQFESKLLKVENLSKKVSVDVKDLSVHNTVEGRIDRTVEKSLYIFPSLRMQKHIMINADAYKKFANKIINIAYKQSNPAFNEVEMLDTEKIKLLFEHAMNENTLKKALNDVDAFLLEDFLNMPEATMIQEYVDKTCEIFEDPNDNHIQRFINLTLAMFDRSIYIMSKQYARLVKEGFDFQEESL